MNVARLINANPGYGTEAIKLFNAMTVKPSGQRARLIANTIKQLQRANIWEKKSTLWVTAAHDDQAGRLDWKNPAGSFLLTKVNSPAFVVDRGFTGDGSTSYLDTNVVLSTLGLGFALNSANVSYWSLTAGTSTLKTDIGVVDAAAGGGIFLKVAEAGNLMPCRLNSATTDSPTVTSDGTGLFTLNRSSSTLHQTYRNGVAGGTISRASTALAANGRLFIGALAVANVASQWNTRQTALSALGPSLTAGEEAAFYNIMQSYMRNIGAA